jgi:hypothetical protein
VKGAIDEYFKTDQTLNAKAIFLLTGFYPSNFGYPPFALLQYIPYESRLLFFLTMCASIAIQLTVRQNRSQLQNGFSSSQQDCCPTYSNWAPSVISPWPFVDFFNTSTPKHQAGRREVDMSISRPASIRCRATSPDRLRSQGRENCKSYPSHLSSLESYMECGELS